MHYFKSRFIEPFCYLEEDGKIYVGFDIRMQHSHDDVKTTDPAEMATKIQASLNELSATFAFEFNRFLVEYINGVIAPPKLKVRKSKPAIVRSIDGGLKISSSK